MFNCGKDTFIIVEKALIERVFSTFINGENTHLYMWKIPIYKCGNDTLYKRVLSTIKYVSLPHFF